jgi:hypothetical protein
MYLSYLEHSLQHDKCEPLSSLTALIA